MFSVITIKDCKLKIGEWCKMKRKTAKLSQNELADLLDISRITLQKLESGKNVTLDNLLKIINHFDDLNKLYKPFDEDIKNNTISSLY